MENTIEQAAQQCGIDLAVSPQAVEFVRLVLRRVNTLPQPVHAETLRTVARAIEEPSSNLGERVLSALFPEGGAA